MKPTIFFAAALLSLAVAPSYAQAPAQTAAEKTFLATILADTLYIKQHFTKTEYQVPMRDGVKLYTIVYAPRDADKVRYPIMLKRTPYSIGPYGPGKYLLRISPSSAMLHEGYIFAFQDVRGKFMSEGTFEDVRPALEKHATKKDIDEGTDTFDTIEFLLKHGPKNNGRVGQWGISYPGFYTTAGLLSRHPALKAASPQAPVTDWFWDDDHHNGAYFLTGVSFWAGFGQPRPQPTAAHAPELEMGTPDGYDYYYRLGPLRNVDAQLFHGQVKHWNDLVAPLTTTRFGRPATRARTCTTSKPPCSPWAASSMPRTCLAPCTLIRPSSSKTPACPTAS